MQEDVRIVQWLIWVQESKTVSFENFPQFKFQLDP